MTSPSRDALRRKRHSRLRLRISGSTERPRLSVFRSAKFIYAQVIDDTTGRTLVLDRGGYQYHGRVRSLAEGAREGGLDL
jgi:large subunit ribosomal protein L18